MEWISVDTRLPEKAGDYICHMRLNMLPPIVKMVSYCKQFTNDKRMSWITSGLVTHWMPLPPPPKED